MVISGIELYENTSNEPINGKNGIILKYDGQANDFKIDVFKNGVEKVISIPQDGDSFLITTKDLTIGNRATTDTGGTNSLSILAPGENAKAILYLGTQDNSIATNAKKAAIIAEGQNPGVGYSRSKLHFCLNNTANNDSTYTARLGRDEVMTLTPNGNVGIGTTSPSYKLDISGNTRFKDTLNVTGNTTFDGDLNIGADLQVNGSTLIDNNLTIGGDLQVNGTRTFVNTTNLDISDNLILLNTGTGTTRNDSGILIQKIQAMLIILRGR